MAHPELPDRCQDVELSLGNRFKNNGLAGGCSLLSVAIQEFIRQKSHIDLEGKTAMDVYQDETVVNCLKDLCVLGKCAEKDLLKIKELQQKKSHVIGLTGKCLDSAHEQVMPSDGNDEPAPPLAHPGGEFKQAKDACLRKLVDLAPVFKQNVEHWMESFRTCDEYLSLSKSATCPSRHQELSIMARLEPEKANLVQTIDDSGWFQDLTALCYSAESMMNTWRIFQAKIHVKVAEAIDVDDTFQIFESTFLKVFEFICFAQTQVADISKLQVCQDSVLASRLSLLRDGISGLETRMSGIACSFGNQPPACILKEKMTLSMRLFGISKWQVTLSSTKVAVVCQSDFENRYKSENICREARAQFGECGAGRGTELTFFNVEVPTNPGPPKRNQRQECKLHFERFYRICLQINLQTSQQQTVECLSLPFTVRTGSGQLWPCVGAVTWYCYTAEEKLYNPPFEYPVALTVDKILSLIRAMIKAVDPDKIFTKEECIALTLMLKSLNGKNPTSDLIGIKKFVMDKLPCQGKSGEERSFSCFTWCVAAVNTHKFLINDIKTQKLQDFINSDQGFKKLADLPERCVRIRLSNNQIESPTGQEPHANVVIQFHSNGNKIACVAQVEEIKKYSLPMILAKFKDEDGRPLVESVFSREITLQKFKASCKESNLPEGHNGYVKTIRKPGDEIIGRDETVNQDLVVKETASASSSDVYGISGGASGKVARLNTNHEEVGSVREGSSSHTGEGGAATGGISETYADLSGAGLWGLDGITPTVLPLTDEEIRQFDDSAEQLFDDSAEQLFDDSAEQLSGGQELLHFPGPVPNDAASLENLFHACLTAD